MGARAIWKGIITFNKTRLPVSLYSAVQDRTVHFHLLHDQDQVRLQQRLVNPITNKTVAYQDARRGLEIERGLFVVLDDEELSSLEPEPSRDIRITRFVPRHAVDPIWHDRPYYLGPDGNDEDYYSFAEALAETDREGIAQWVMRKKRYVGALHSDGKYLILNTLRFAEQVIDPSALAPPGGAKPTKKEQMLAERLVAALDERFNPDDYHDEYRQRVMELIETKQRGGRVQLKKYKPKPRAKTLEEMLEASLAAG